MLHLPSYNTVNKQACEGKRRRNMIPLHIATLFSLFKFLNEKLHPPLTELAGVGPGEERELLRPAREAKLTG